jgi:hypothetical protein
VTRTLGYFLAGAIAGWAVMAGAAQALYPERAFGLLCASVAGLICIVPTAISLLMTLWSNNKTGSEQLMALVGGMGLRMLVVMGMGLAVFVPESPLHLPQLRENRSGELAFWAFVLVSYLGTLAWETFLASRSPAKPAANAIGGAK